MQTSNFHILHKRTNEEVEMGVSEWVATELLSKGRQKETLNKPNNEDHPNLKENDTQISKKLPK